MTERMRRLERSPARSRRKRSRSRPHVPTTIASPSPRRLLPTIEPVICALATPGFPAPSTKSARMSSAMFPNVTLRSPPTADPARRATWSVPRRIHSALGDHAHGGPVAQDLGDARHDLRRVVAYRDEGVGAERLRVGDGLVKRLGA